MPRSIGNISPLQYDLHGGSTWNAVTLLEFDNGHREATITRTVRVSEPPREYAFNRDTGQWDPIPDGHPSLAEDKAPRGAAADREASIERATRRARKAARVRCKASGYDSLFTFTYRDNVQDRDLVAVHWKETVRRIKRILPDFSYVAVLERQKRGALHLHVATHRLPASFTVRGVKLKSWNVLRSIWRSVVGDLGGNFDESKRQRCSRAGSFRIARYITKYIAKDFEDGELDRKRYWQGGPWKAPRRVTMLFPSARDARTVDGDVLGLVFDDLAGAGAEFTHWLSPGGSCYWIAAYVPPS